MKRFSALLLLVPVVAAAEESEELLSAAALAADNQCDPAAGGDCSLSALQKRSQKQSVEASEEAHGKLWGSCAQYGCSHSYHSWMGCQCNSACAQYGNCCSDYYSICAPATQPANLALAIVPAPEPTAGDNSTAILSRANSTAIPPRANSTVNPPVKSTPGQLYGHPTPGASYPAHAGFTLMLVEEFNSPIDLDSDPIWTWSDGGLTEGQVRFQKQNILFQDGKMKILVSSTPAANPQTCSHAEVADIPDKPLSSGEFRSRHNSFRYGRYEVRMKAPSVKPGNPSVDGNFISTMFVYRDAKYKHWREIDFEITGDGPAAVTTNVLSADNTDRWKSGIQESRQVSAPNTRTDFHTYAFEWLPTSITWYIDGEKVRQKTGGGVPIPDMSGKVMMNMWIFGENYGFGGPQGHNNVYPMESEYDWFRFYTWDGETHYPCAGFGAGCLTSDDQYLSGNNPCDGIPQIGTVYGKDPCTAACHR
mmetsp:Transcript_104432/g.336588  ORF Transcript_104432/g.336588 Transcript_104432/m.336588 type:complete len:477 (-) Transcript_104432:105-1535(-)